LILFFPKTNGLIVVSCGLLEYSLVKLNVQMYWLSDMCSTWVINTFLCNKYMQIIPQWIKPDEQQFMSMNTCIFSSSLLLSIIYSKFLEIQLVFHYISQVFTWNKMWMLYYFYIIFTHSIVCKMWIWLDLMALLLNI